MEEEPDKILIDIRKSDLTLGEVLARIEQYKQDPEYRDCEIFLDGDAYAIVARRKVKNHEL
jgi:hypothetical protein